MRRDPCPPRSAVRCAAFSLVEVTMATGIVAAVALPVLAMLAGAGNMHSVARDREVAADIAHQTLSSLVATAEGGCELTLGEGVRILVSGLADVIDSVGGSTRAYASFDAEGHPLAEISEKAWESGREVGDDAFHLIRIEWKHTEDVTLHSLYDVSLEVSQPARAERNSRSSESFQTRFSIR